MICDLLEMSGYEVKLLRMGEQTVENLQEEKFDLVVMDKLLSGIDGTTVCAEIRSIKAISNTPILMMSALYGARTNCMEAGATDFVNKPFEMKDFLAKIGDSMNKERDVTD
jgi:DNA-binding response OmpR family regulator